MNEMRVNDSEMCEMKQRSLVNAGYISPQIAWWIQTKEERKSERDWFLTYLENEKLKN